MKGLLVKLEWFLLMLVFLVDVAEVVLGLNDFSQNKLVFNVSRQVGWCFE
jgi:hypothetical protein